jgi:cytochrome c551/c552
MEIDRTLFLTLTDEDNIAHIKGIIGSHLDQKIRKMQNDLKIDYRTLCFLIRDGKSPESCSFKCLNCSSDIKTSRCLYFAQYCCRACSQVHRRIIDPDYQKNINQKAKISRNTKNFDGLTPAQIGAIKSAKTKRDNRSYDDISKKIVESNSRFYKEKKEKRNQRLRIILRKRGIVNFVRFILRNRKKGLSKELRISSVVSVLKFITDELMVSDIFDPLVIWSKITSIPIIAKCQNCEKEYSLKSFCTDSVTIKNNLSKFCCISCMNIHRNIEKSKLPKISLSQERRQQISENLKIVHKNNPEGSRLIAKKALDTMKKLDKISSRRDKALETKLKRGVINEIRFHKESTTRTEYRKYKNLVFSETKKQDLETLENYKLRGKHTWHLDHIFPIASGYFIGIPYELIGDIKNLRMLSAMENRKKSNKIQCIPEHILQYLQESGKIDHFLIQEFYDKDRQD